MSPHKLAGNLPLRTYFQGLTALAIQQKLGRDIFRKGLDYYENDAVESLEALDGNTVGAEVYGSDEYEVKIYTRSGNVQAKCSCPYDTEWGGICKHIAAVLIKASEEEFWREVPEAAIEIAPEDSLAFPKVDVFESWLGSLTADELRQTVRRLASPVFREEVRLRHSSRGERDAAFLDTKKKIQHALKKLGRYDGGRDFEDAIEPLFNKLKGLWTDRPEEVRDLFVQIVEAIGEAQEDGSLFDEYSEESYDGNELMGYLADFLCNLPDAKRLEFLPGLWEALQENGYDSFSAFFETANEYLKPSDWSNLKSYLGDSELLSNTTFAQQTLEIFSPAMTTDEKGEWLKNLAKSSDAFILPLAQFYEKEKNDMKKAVKTLDKALEKWANKDRSFGLPGDTAKQVLEERIRLATAQKEPPDDLALRYVELLPEAKSLHRALELAPKQRQPLEDLLRKKNIYQYLVHLETENRLDEVVDIIEKKKQDFSPGYSFGFSFGFSRYDFYARNKKSFPDKALVCFKETLEAELQHTGDRHYASVVDALRNMKAALPEAEFRRKISEIKMLYGRRRNLMGMLAKAFG